MILTIFELSILLDGLKELITKDFFTKSGKNKTVLTMLTHALKEMHNEMVDLKLTEWEVMSDVERGQKIIRPKYDPDYVDNTN